MEYIVHVFNRAVSRTVENKRFKVEATDPQAIVNELAAKVLSYYGSGYELARLEKISVVEDVVPIKYGTNWNTLAA